MIHYFAHTQQGRFIAGHCEAGSLAEDWEDLKLPPIADLQLSWIDVIDPSKEELEWLGKFYHFHPLALEDCLHFDQRPKIEEYSDHLFLVLHGLREANREERQESDFCDVELYELHFFLTDRVLVTVHKGDILALNNYRNKVERDRNQLPTQIDFALHRILDLLMDANPVHLRKIEVITEDLDEQVLSGEGSWQKGIERVHEMQKQINELRRVFKPQLEIYKAIIEEDHHTLSEQAKPYIRDVMDHLIHLQESIEGHRESIWSIRDTYLAVAAQKTNETMKRLTFFSLIFLPLTFITGFFGMNFEHIPFKEPMLLVFSIVIMGAIPIVMGRLMKNRGWW